MKQSEETRFREYNYKKVCTLRQTKVPQNFQNYRSPEYYLPNKLQVPPESQGKVI